MNFILGVAVGTFVGWVLWYLFDRKTPLKTSGTFYMDFSDPNKDVCRLDLEEDPNDIYTKKYIVLKISTHE